MKKPTPQTIKEWLKQDVSQWFLERIAYHLNSIDTVRDITPDKKEEAVARKIAIDIVENALGDIYSTFDIKEKQRVMGEEEKNLIKTLKALSNTDY